MTKVLARSELLAFSPDTGSILNTPEQKTAIKMGGFGDNTVSALGGNPLKLEVSTTEIKYNCLFLFEIKAHI
jgi:hypothetical protein